MLIGRCLRGLVGRVRSSGHNVRSVQKVAVYWAAFGGQLTSYLMRSPCEQFHLIFFVREGGGGGKRRRHRFNQAIETAEPNHRRRRDKNVILEVYDHPTRFDSSSQRRGTPSTACGRPGKRKQKTKVPEFSHDCSYAVPPPHSVH